jgi:hypothetical protein
MAASRPTHSSTVWVPSPITVTDVRGLTATRPVERRTGQPNVVASATSLSVMNWPPFSFM